MEKLRAWCESCRGQVEPRCLLGTAVGYIRNQWVRLSRFLEYAAMDLTNNETTLTTCHKMGIDPRAYLRDTLRRLLAGEKDLSVLLPESYAARVAAVTAKAEAATTAVAA